MQNSKAQLKQATVGWDDRKCKVTSGKVGTNSIVVFVIKKFLEMKKFCFVSFYESFNGEICKIKDGSIGSTRYAAELGNEPERSKICLQYCA